MDRPTGPFQTTENRLMIANGILGLLVVVVAVAGIYGLSAIPPDVDPEYATAIADEVQDRLTEHSDVIVSESGEIAQEVLPVIADQVTTRLRRDYPRYIRVLSDQGEQLTVDVEEMFVAKVKERYRGLLRKHRAVLAEEFPERGTLEDFERIMAEFEKASDRLVERYYIDEFRPTFQQTLALWDQVEPAPKPGAEGTPLDDQLGEYFADWFVLAFSHETQERLTQLDLPGGGDTNATN